MTKLDPDKQLKAGDIEAIATSGTDALMLSGTLNVTQENLATLQKQVSLPASIIYGGFMVQILLHCIVPGSIPVHIE